MTACHKLVLLDFCSEKNRGDAAMQTGLMTLVRTYFPEAETSVISVFGANQIRHIKNEYDHTYDKGIFFGGLKPTFYPFNGIKIPEFIFELLNVAASILSLWILFLMALHIPGKFIVRLIPSEYRNTYRTLSVADLVIWNGRNFRPRKCFLIDTYRMFNLIFHPLICILMSKRVACVGASIWPLKNPVSRFLLRYVLTRCIFVSVREKSSHKNALELVGKEKSDKVYLLPDLSFAAFPAWLKRREGVKKETGKEAKFVGITLVDWKSDGSHVRENYRDAIIQTIKGFIQRDVSIMIIPQVSKNWESSEKIYEEIVSAFSQIEQKQIILYTGASKVNDLLDVYAGLDILIATRMHSAIFSLVAGTPVIAIAYDQGGKWGILSDLGLHDFVIPYSKISSDLIMNKINLMLKNREILLTEINKKVLIHIDMVEQNIIKIDKQKNR